MTSRELQGAFEYEVNKHDAPNRVVPSDEIFYWLNKAINEFVEGKFENNIEAFEQTQKVTDELKDLIEEISISTVMDPVLGRANWSYVGFPDDYLHKVSEFVEIEFRTHPFTNDIISPDSSLGNVYIKLVGVTDSSSGTVNHQLVDPFSEHILHYEHAKPLRLFYKEGVQLVSDGNYLVKEYKLKYLKKPTIIDLEGSEPTYLPDSTHFTIAKVAALLYLRSIGATAPQQQPESK